MLVDDKSPMEATPVTPFVFATAIPWQNLGSGVERKILGFDNQLMMVLVRFEKGAIGSLHHHVHR